MNRFITFFLNSKANSFSYQKPSAFNKIKSLAIKLSLIGLGLAFFIGLVYVAVFIFTILLCVAVGLFIFFFIKDRFFNKKIRRSNKYSSDCKYGGYDRAYKVNYKPSDDDVV
jgi:hypothetical protein